MGSDDARKQRDVIFKLDCCDERERDTLSLYKLGDF